MVEPIKAVEPEVIVTQDPVFSPENLPKSKEEWNSLKEKDPSKWTELTQTNIDRYFRENKELHEKLQTFESREKNLKAELDQYKGSQIGVQPPVESFPTLTGQAGQPYSISNPPKTKEEWDNFFIEDPTSASDLRTDIRESQKQVTHNFTSAQTNSRKEVQKEHPDMYLPELDEKGAPKRDEKGNLVLKVNAHTGEPIFNPDSQKGKLWGQVWQDSIDGSGVSYYARLPNGPLLMMADMERRLKVGGQQMISEAEQGRQARINEGQVLPEGVPPPVPEGKVTFKSKEEQTHAEQQVSRGTFKNLAEYCLVRDNKSGVYEENSTPKFN
jgi:hypothetical protein